MIQNKGFWLTSRERFNKAGRTCRVPSQGRSGQGMTEYLILLVLVAVGSLIAVKQLGAAVKGRFEKAQQAIVDHI